MKIYEILIPGTVILSNDQAWSRLMGERLDSLRMIFFEANMALNLFLLPRFTRTRVSIEELDRRHERTNQILSKLKNDFFESKDPSKNHPEYSDAQHILKHEIWESGVIPQELFHHIPHIHAKAFLFALDSFDRLLQVFKQEKAVPTMVGVAHERFQELFPHLRSVRNSAHHSEDRMRRLDNKNKIINPQPIEEGFLKNPTGNIFGLNNLIGSKIGSTGNDGHYHEVDVSFESMDKLATILNEVNSSFQWSGPSYHAPPL